MKSAAVTTANTVNPSTDNSNQPQQKQTAKEAIAANVQTLIEQLEQGHSEGLTAYLTAMGRFHNYSFGNILEIARQKPDATRVAGLYAWNQLKRRVKKGERGIRILAPVIGIKRKKDEEAEKDIRTQNHAVSLYGMGRFPVTLYKEQWLHILASAPEIETFIRENDAKLKTKE